MESGKEIESGAAVDELLAARLGYPIQITSLGGQTYGQHRP